MDHRATTAGVTSALDSSMSLSTRTNAVIESWHHAPPLMYALHNEISDLVVVLDSTSAATEVDTSREHGKLLEDLEKPLAEARRLLARVESLVEELLEAHDGRTRGRVLSRDGKTATFKDRLRDVRIAMHDCLLLHNVYGYQCLFPSPAEADVTSAK